MSKNKKHIVKFENGSTIVYETSGIETGRSETRSLFWSPFLYEEKSTFINCSCGSHILHTPDSLPCGRTDNFGCI